MSVYGSIRGRLRQMATSVGGRWRSALARQGCLAAARCTRNVCAGWAAERFAVDFYIKVPCHVLANVHFERWRKDQRGPTHFVRPWREAAAL